MTDAPKTLEERMDEVEAAAHVHADKYTDLHPEAAKELRTEINLKNEDAKKAAEAGKVHGDPVFVVG
jgi:hypothetical protein